jgi:hypothetical protein
MLRLIRFSSLSRVGRIRPGHVHERLTRAEGPVRIYCVAQYSLFSAGCVNEIDKFFEGRKYKVVGAQISRNPVEPFVLQEEDAGERDLFPGIVLSKPQARRGTADAQRAVKFSGSIAPSPGGE